jgi:signal transduction histidine kinase
MTKLMALSWRFLLILAPERAWARYKPVLKGKANMATGESNVVKRISESPINSTLLRLIHHELGNGLAVLSGYRHLLQREIFLQAQETAPPEPDVWRHRNKQWLGYLRIMQDRETLLNDFLAQLRALRPVATYGRLCQSFVRADLVVLLRKVIERLVPLYPDHTLRVHLSVQSLFIMCDPFWIELVLEHVMNHTLAAHTASTPVDISLEPSTDSSHMVQEAKIAIHIKRTLPGPNPRREEVSETWSQVLSPGDRELCFAICREVFQEHGGRIWYEQGGEQEEIVFLALPLVK